MPLSDRQEKKKVVIDTKGNEIVEQGDSDTDESMLKHSLDDDIVSRRKEDLTDAKKEVLISHISIPFEDLRKDMATVSTKTNLSLS